MSSIVKIAKITPSASIVYQFLVFFFQGVFERKFPFMIGRQMYFGSLLTTLPPPTPVSPPPPLHCSAL